MSKRTDFAGNEIKIGDRVVYVSAYYNSLKYGVIEKFTPKMISIIPEDLGIKRASINRFIDQVVKIK